MEAEEKAKAEIKAKAKAMAVALQTLGVIKIAKKVRQQHNHTISLQVARSTLSLCLDAGGGERSNLRLCTSTRDYSIC